MDKAFEKKAIPKKSKGLSEWYNKVVLETELADYGPARGTMIFRPYGYAIWEAIQRCLDERIKAHGVENAYFPLFIPSSLLHKEKEHVEGFSPQLAVVTIGGGQKLKEPLIVRPTSETVMYEAYSRWIKSWRDLPTMINQWNNVVRWEKRTYLFLRTTEFLWQEGHTAHVTHEEATETMMWAIDMYAKAYRELMALPGYVGKKSELEKFAGADVTMTYESLMPEGKALQGGTSHDLGQNFSKPFDIKFQDKDSQIKYVWQTSWGLSTRSIGALIMTHGDDQGLVLPPRLAPIQVIVLPVEFDEDALSLCRQVVGKLKDAGVRVKLDEREDESLGYRINKWELKGVPLRIEVGKKEVGKQQLTFVRRDNSDKSEQPVSSLLAWVQDLLDKIQQDMLSQAERYLKQNTIDVGSYDEFKEIMGGTRGMLRAFWCEGASCEEKIKTETKATVRCLELGSQEESGVCIYCGKQAKARWLFAQGY